LSVTIATAIICVKKK